jgi:translation elongation factor Ts
MISASMVKELRESTGAGMLDCKKALEASNGNMEEAITWLREKGISKAAKKASRIAAEGLAVAKVVGNKAVIVEVNSETDFVAKNEEFKSLVDIIADILLNNSSVKTVEEANKLTHDAKTIEELVIEKTSTIGEKLSFRRFEIVEKEDSQVFGTYSHMGGKIVALCVLTKDEEVAKDIAMQIAAMKPLYLNRDMVPADVLEKERTILKEQAENEGLDPNKIDMIVNGRINKYYEEVCLVDQGFIKENKMKVNKYVESKGSEIVSFVRYEVGEGMEKREENFADEVMKQING